MNVNAWRDLLKLTLLGTDRHPEPLRGEGRLGIVLEAIYPAAAPPADREKAALHAAAVLASYRSCGRKPQLRQVPLPAEAAPEHQPPVNAAAGRHLAFMLAEGRYREVLPEWLAAVAATGKRVAEGLLPDLLDAGRQDRQIRPAVIRVAGNRGRWLAGLHESWSYALAAHAGTGADDPAWEEGNFAARVLYLKELRAVDPVRALALVGAAWQSEGAGERAQLLQTLETGLTMDDEPFLEACLDDRSREVRRTAAALLAAMGDSRFSLRMAARLAASVSVKTRSGLLTLGKRQCSLDITLPQQWCPDFDRDGLVQKPPAGKGEKAWWLEQIVAAVPPSWWTRQWGISPGELLAGVAGSEWEDLFFSAWSLAARRHRDGAWAEALLEKRLDDPHLWEALPGERREHLVRQLLPRAAKNPEILQLLPRVPAPWSSGLTRAAAEAWKDLLAGQKERDYRLQAPLRACALRMAPADLPAVQSALAAGMKEDSAWRGIVSETLDVLNFRAAMLKEIEGGK